MTSIKQLLIGPVQRALSSLMLADGQAILLAFSLLPFFIIIKFYLYGWFLRTQALDPIASISLYKIPLFLASDVILCLVLASMYVFIFAVVRLLTSRCAVPLALILPVNLLIVVFSTISLKTNQIYGTPLHVHHLRMADDLLTMRESIMSNVDWQGMLVLLAGVALTLFALLYRENFHERWAARRGSFGLLLITVSVLLAGGGFKELRGIYTYGLKKNALVNFVRYYKPLPEPKDFRSLGQRLRSEVPPNVDWFVPEQTKNAGVNRLSYPAASARGQNMILIVLELTANGYIDRETTPNLFRLQQNAIVFDRYYTTAVNSFRATYSIFYSDYMADTSRFGHPKTIYDGPLVATSVMKVANLQGYRTGIFFSGFLAYTDMGYLWCGKGVDSLNGANSILQKTGGIGWTWGAQESQTVDVMNNWITEHHERPFFAVYQTAYPHHPYHTPTRTQPFPNDSWRNRYRNSLHYVDQNVGRLLRQLKRANLLSKTTIAVVGDHGETLDDIRAGHGIRMDLNEIHVPFFIHNPQLFDRQIVSSVPSNHLDLAPTLLGLLGLTAPEDWSGRNLLSPLVLPKKLYVQRNANVGQSAIIDSKLIYVRDDLTGSDRFFLHTVDGLQRHPEFSSDMRMKKRYATLARYFEPWVLLRHLEKACQSSVARPLHCNRPHSAEAQLLTK
jgi:hypothetical protein